MTPGYITDDVSRGTRGCIINFIVLSSFLKILKDTKHLDRNITVYIFLARKFLALIFGMFLKT